MRFSVGVRVVDYVSCCVVFVVCLVPVLVDVTNMK